MITCVWCNSVPVANEGEACDTCNWREALTFFEFQQTHRGDEIPWEELV